MLRGYFRKAQPGWAERMERRIMAKLDDQLAAVTAFLTGISADVGAIADATNKTNTEVAKIGTDTQSLLDQIGAIPRPGLTPEQQAALDNIANLAQSIAGSTTAVKTSAQAAADAAQALDDKVPDADAKPAEVVAQAQAAANGDGAQQDAGKS